MTKRTTFFAVVLTLCLGLLGGPLGCAGKQDKSDGAAGKGLTKEELPNPFLRDIPADSPVVFTGLEPAPEGVMKAALEPIQQMFERPEMKEALEKAQEGMGEEMPATHAFLTEQGLWEHPTEYQRLGLPENPMMAFYMVGTVPVLRIELADGMVLEKLFAALEKDAGEAADEIEVRETDGIRYREVDLDGEGSVVLRLAKDELVMGFSTADQRAAFMPYFLGKQQPEETLAAAGLLEKMAERHGLQPYSLGYVDIRKLIELGVAEEPGTGLVAKLAGPMRFAEEISEECRKEWRWIGETMPRIVGGMTEMSETVYETKLVAELAESVATQLKGLNAPTIGADTDYARTSILSAGLAVDVHQMVELAAKWRTELQQEPFRCETFREVNGLAMMMQRADMIPQSLRSISSMHFLFKDFSFRVKSVISKVDVKNIGINKKMEGESAEGSEGNDGTSGEERELHREYAVTSALLLGTSEADPLLSMMRMAGPQVPVDELRKREGPVAIELPAEAKDYVEKVFAQVGAEGLGMAAGEGASEAIGKLVGASSGDTPVLRARFDTARALRSFADSGLATAREMKADPSKYPGVSAEDVEQAMEGFEMLKSIAPEQGAPSSTSMGFNAQGVYFVSRSEGDWSIWSVFSETSSEKLLGYAGGMWSVLGMGGDLDLGQEVKVPEEPVEQYEPKKEDGTSSEGEK